MLIYYLIFNIHQQSLQIYQHFENKFLYIPLETDLHRSKGVFNLAKGLL